MNLVNIFIRLHGGQRPLSIFLQLLIIKAVSVYFGLPFKGGLVLDFIVFEIKQEGPDEFAIDKIVEALVSAAREQFQQVSILLWSLVVINEKGTFLNMV